MDDKVLITLNDLQIIVNMIDVCTKRGAFEGKELLTVGQLREKVSRVIEIHTQNSNEMKTDKESEN
jgi:hypothetical protein